MSEPLEFLLVLAAVAALPLVFLALTAFVKIATVLQIVRSALGAPGIPSNAVILALSAALTLIAMAPVGGQIVTRLTPVMAEPAADTVEWLQDVTEAVVEPLRDFLAKHSTDREKQRFTRLLTKPPASGATPPEVSDRDLRVLVPAFLASELLRAFSLGFAIFLPFLVIDLVVANVLVGLGMQAMQPAQVSLPFKLLLFVATDGWGLLAEVLVAGYLR